MSTPETETGTIAHLRAHTVQSIAEGVLPIDRLAELCVDNGMTAIGVANTTGLFDALEIAKTLKGAGLKTIMGLTLYVTYKGRRGRLGLIAQDQQGWRNLMRLSTMCYETAKDPNGAFRGAPLALEALQPHLDGLIAIDGGPGALSDVFARDGNAEVALAALGSLLKGRIYHSPDYERPEAARLYGDALKHGLLPIAAPEVLTARREEQGAYDIVAAVATGLRLDEVRADRSRPRGHFLTPAEMQAAFAPFPGAIENTLKVIECVSFELAGAKQVMPPYDGLSPAEEMARLRHLSVQGLDWRLANLPFPGGTEEDYRKQLEFELGVIEKTGFAGYFLTIADIVGYAHRSGIPVGPGRGSGAGSLVAYALRITNIDPLRFGLLFERFLNPDRVSIPDIDIDFCRDRRDLVIDYIRERFGDKNVGHIITFQSIQSKSAIRDVGRVMGTDKETIEEISRAIPVVQGNAIEIKDFREKIPEIAAIMDRNPEVADLVHAASTIEGVYRQVSTHAAGVVVAEAPLDTICPVYIDPANGHRVTQYSMKWAEAAGLVKHDILGLKTLTLIRAILDRIPEDQRPDFERMDLSDKDVYEALSAGDTLGVFQLEGDGITQAVVQLEPHCFDDIVAILSLYRPGPMEYVQTYIDRRHGRAPVAYLHPLMEPILKETHGIMIYQEQVMKVAQVLAGYTLAQADLLRRAMGKKIQAEMDAQKSRFVEGALAAGIDNALAARIFDDVNAFAGYGFNKSHATAYAVLAYQTAYLKVHFPGAFYAAYMTIESDQASRVGIYQADLRAHGLGYVGPSVNASDYQFRHQRKGRSSKDTIVHGLCALPGLGHAAAATIVAKRPKGGYASLEDLLDRCAGALNKAALTALARSGALDDLADRAQVVGNLDSLSRKAAGENQGQASLFGGATGDGDDAGGLLPAQVAPWTPWERQEHEIAVLGFPALPVKPRQLLHQRRRRRGEAADGRGQDGQEAEQVLLIEVADLADQSALRQIQVEALLPGGTLRIGIAQSGDAKQMMLLPFRYRSRPERLAAIQQIHGVQSAAVASL